MSFDWSHFLNLAQELSGLPPSSSGEEAKLRSAVSRAYYAAFCKARNHLRDVDGVLIEDDVTAHQTVKAEFSRSGIRERRQIGWYLDALRVSRNNADYRDTVTRLPDVARLALLHAAEVLSTLSRL